MESYISLYDGSSRNYGQESQLPLTLHPVTISVNFCGPVKPLPIGSNQGQNLSELERSSYLQHSQQVTVGPSNPSNPRETMNAVESEQRSGGNDIFSHAKPRQSTNIDITVRQKMSSSSKLTSF